LILDENAEALISRWRQEHLGISDGHLGKLQDPLLLIGAELSAPSGDDAQSLLGTSERDFAHSRIAALV